MAVDEQVHRATEKYGHDWSIRINRNADGSWWVENVYAQMVLLQEIRDELKRLNTLLHCGNFIGIPRTLKTISRKLPVPVKRKVKGTPR